MLIAVSKIILAAERTFSVFVKAMVNACFVDGAAADGEGLYVLINPEILETSGSQTGEEGCLSVPGMSGVVTRPDYVKVKAYDENMEEFILEGTELLARAICHETDHLHGKLYTELVEGELHRVNYEEEE